LAKSSLGRGLGAIFDEVGEAYQRDLSPSTNNNDIIELDINNIKPNPYQPRKNFDEAALAELSESIKEHGLIQPIVVMLDNDEYIIIAGERRYRASKLAGFEKIKAVILDISVDKIRELAIIENIQREELNPIELAQAYQKLIEEYEVTHEELAQKVKKSRTSITNTLRLLALSDFVQKRVIAKEITTGHAKILVGLDKKMQKRVTESIIGQKLSVRETEQLVKSLKNSEDKSNQSEKSVKYNTNELKDSLKNAFFKSKINGNKLVIEFNNEAELSKLVQFFEKSL
jgi:ParB family chromosome partitioning protein